MASSLSISIVVYDPPVEPSFYKVLEALNATVFQARCYNMIEDCNLTLIDNGDNDRILDEAIRHSSEIMAINLISNSNNVGYSAHNQAIFNSNSDYHLILNPDVLMAATALSAGFDYLRNHDETVMICPYSEDQTGSPSYLCKRYPALLDLVLRGFAPEVIKKRFNRRLSQYEYRDQPVDNSIQSVELISGCCILARTSTLKACGGFDDKFFLYFEDFDLSVRMSQIGPIDYCADMHIVHYGGGASQKGLRHIWWFVQSAAKFYLKHGLRLA